MREKQDKTFWQDLYRQNFGVPIKADKLLGFGQSYLLGIQSDTDLKELMNFLCFATSTDQISHHVGFDGKNSFKDTQSFNMYKRDDYTKLPEFPWKLFQLPKELPLEQYTKTSQVLQ